MYIVYHAAEIFNMNVYKYFFLSTPKYVVHLNGNVTTVDLLPGPTQGDLTCVSGMTQ